MASARYPRPVQDANLSEYRARDTAESRLRREVQIAMLDVSAASLAELRPARERLLAAQERLISMIEEREETR